MNSPKIDWGNAEIVDREQEYYKRCFFPNHIMAQKDIMNRDHGILPQVYINVS